MQWESAFSNVKGSDALFPNYFGEDLFRIAIGIAFTMKIKYWR